MILDYVIAHYCFHCLSTTASASIVLSTAATTSIALSTARKLLFAAAAGVCQPYFLVGCFWDLQHVLVVQQRGGEAGGRGLVIGDTWRLVHSSL